MWGGEAWGGGGVRQWNHMGCSQTIWSSAKMSSILLTACLLLPQGTQLMETAPIGPISHLSGGVVSDVCVSRTTLSSFSPNEREGEEGGGGGRGRREGEEGGGGGRERRGRERREGERCVAMLGGREGYHLLKPASVGLVTSSTSIGIWTKRI